MIFIFQIVIGFALIASGSIGYLMSTKVVEKTPEVFTTIIRGMDGENLGIRTMSTGDVDNFFKKYKIVLKDSK